ncbi:MAG: hypothetical protein E7218_02605 [Anaerofustis stercorihominis]|nr:hypothetical protein [Anaerofustis stercorihominis]
MKKIYAALLCVLMVMSLGACSTDEIQINNYPVTSFEAAELQTKVYDKFTFQYPSSWSVEIDVDMSMVTDSATVFAAFAPPGETGYMASFSVLMAMNQQVQTMDIKKEYVQSLMDDMQAETGYSFEISEFGYYNIGGETVAIYTALTNIDGVSAEVTQAMTVIDRTLYLFNINCYGEENHADAYAILSSLVFKDVQAE